MRGRQKSHSGWLGLGPAPRVRSMTSQEPSRAASPSRPSWSPTRARSRCRSTDPPRPGPTGRRRPPRCSARPADFATTTPTTPCGPSSTRTTLDGIPRQPARYARAHRPRSGSSTRPTAPGGRDVRVELRGDDAKQLNAEALADLDGGATSLWLHAGPDTDLAAVLDGVLLDLAPVVLDPTDAPVTVARRFLAAPRRHRARRRHQPGRPADAADDDLVAVARLAARARRARPSSSTPPPSTTAAPPRPRSSAGRWPRPPACCACSRRPGIPPSEAADLVEFRYAATDEQFLTIAKLRAARLLCGTGCSSSARRRPSSSASTPSPVGR